ncbi:MAG: Hpt domain-containing protein [Solirubrobacterales bacterium]
MTIISSELPVIDIAYLEDMREWVGDDTLRTLIDDAPASIAAELASISQSWQADDLHAVRENGHRLKGAAGSLALRRLADLGHTVQRIDDLADGQVLGLLEDTAAEALRALADYRATKLLPAA